ncbi:hypothetical protein A7K50_12330 [Dehalobacter sp. MCB1]|uniref:hypothetical protein n=1 Tax=Dehalobacter sp. MCB1 TaxID=1844756 RepID=UPI000E6B6345|nr:hypothetical protein [Dehalobacter sp. MCB1]RJE48242.1 hypothetical protein A7K50_12330 [Dehalobacter sp. MCB1]TCX49723.1 hypothetical protein C1I36_10100 [Dehalobacter sp. 14DCB1]TCX50154.1 hypothetical protein C1I38_12180 [Dehalobacter sp. 12DCB1]
MNRSIANHFLWLAIPLTIILEYENNIITSNIGENYYFLHVFRFTQDKISSPKVEFLDKAGKRNEIRKVLPYNKKLND